MYSDYQWLLAARAYQNDMTCEFGEFDKTSKLVDIKPTPEASAMSNTSWEKLSNESKELVAILIKLPPEIQFCFTTKLNKVNASTRQRLFNWLSRIIGFDKAELVFEELTEFVRAKDFHLPDTIVLKSRMLLPEKQNMKANETKVIRKNGKVVWDKNRLKPIEEIKELVGESENEVESE